MARTSDKLNDRLKRLATAPSVEAPQPKKFKARRAVDRIPSFKFGRISLQTGEDIRCVVKDMSPSGAKIALEGAFTLPLRAILTIEQMGRGRRVTIEWQEGPDVGVSFDPLTA